MSIKIHDKEFRVMIPEEQIQKTIAAMANKMNNDLSGKDVIFIGILNGSFLFAADLMRHINLDSRITFLKVASYEGTTSTGTVKRLIGINEDLKGKTVVVLEDIVDTGNTMTSIVKQLNGYEPKEILIATMLLKPTVFKDQFKLDYVGEEIPDVFVVGYGLDYDGLGRNYQDIYSLAEKLSGNFFHNIILFGAPGSGKGTQAKMIIDKHNLVHLSTGDMLRAEIEANTKTGQEAKQLMKGGGLVTDELALRMIENKLMLNKGTSGFIFDGFPRTIEQAKGLDALMKRKGMEISVMLALRVDDKVLTDKLLERGKVGNRKDDTPEIIKNRLRIYHATTKQVGDYYKKQGKLIDVNGEDTVGNVFNVISRAINNL